jgi:hypothetical protein
MSAEAASMMRPRLMARQSEARRAAAPAARPARTSSSTPRRAQASVGVGTGRAARSRATRINLLAGIVILLAMLFHVWTGLAVGTLGYELSRARDLGQRLDRQLNELSVENSGLMKPDVLADEAHRRLGLVSPQSGQIVDLP